MKILKYVLYALGALLVLVVVGVVIVVATFNPNDYKPAIVKMVKDKTGRTLTIEGDIGLKLFPKIGAQISQARLSDRASEAEFAGVNRLQVFVALLPLLSKDIVVDEVRLDGLRANLIKFKDGSTNFSDLTQSDKSKDATPEAPAPQSKTKPLQLNVAGIRLTNSRVTWKDQTNGNDIALELKQLQTGHIADKTPTRIKLDMLVKGTQPKVDLQTDLSGNLTFDLQTQLYTFNGLDAHVTGSALDFSNINLGMQGDIEANGGSELITMAKLAVSAKANRGNDVFDVKLSTPRVQSSPQTVAVDALALSASGAVAGIVITQSSLKAPRLQLNLAANQVLVDGLVFTAQGKSGADNVDLSLSAPKLEVSDDKASGEAMSITGKLTGAERRGDINLKLSAVEGSAKALKVGALALELDAKQKDNAVKGTFSTPIVGNLETRTFELPKIAAKFQVTSPSIPQKTVDVPLAGSVLANLGTQRVGADLTAHFDESNIKAKFGIVKFSAPAYDFDIAVDKLNLDRYLPPKQAKQARGKPTPKSGEDQPKTKEPEKPIDLSALKSLDMNGKLQVGDLQANNIKARNVRVELKAKDGRLDINPLAAHLYQGTMAGAVSINANTNQFAVKQKLTGISIGPLLRDAVDKDILEGKGNVALDVTTSGNLVSAMKRQLNGTARLDLRDGAIKGIDLAGAVRTVKAKFGGKDAEGTASTGEKTDFSELSASFDIKNGIAHNQDLSLKSPFIRVAGEGDVNLGEDTLNYVVKTAVVSTTAGQGGKELSDLKGLTIPVRVSGPYAALKYKVEFSQMLSGAGKEALKETAKEALKGQLNKDQLKDLGKQLLGGGQKSGTQSGPAGDAAEQGTAAAPPKKPEDQIKEKLKGLFK